jgi:DNA-binding transcriptional MerR regulator
MPQDHDYSIGELAAMAGVTPRTVRYYVSVGLLPSPGRQGPQTRYGEGHLARLRLIKRLQREHLPLLDIARRMEGLDYEAVREALESDRPGMPVAAADGQDSAVDYIRRLREATPQTRASMAAAVAAPTIAPAPAPKGPQQPQRTQWEHVALGQNVELHIRRPLGRLEQRRVERLIRIGREILEEEAQP